VAQRAARKELAATERRLARLRGELDALGAAMAAQDPAGYARLAELADLAAAAQAEIAAAEDRWLELAQSLE
jgi:hypothetical protein